MFARLIAAVVVSAAVATAVTAQTTRQPSSPLIIKSVYGRDLYEFYCATCHGRDGKGGGPVAPALTTRPTDLTTIAARHGGTFPRARVESYVAEDGVPLVTAHGSKDMPVWGPIFRSLDPSDTMAKVRVANLADYLASIQERPRTPPR